MVKKCKKGYKRVGNKCKTKVFYLGVTEGDKKTLSNLLGRTIFTISTWGAFWAIINLTGLIKAHPLVLLAISLGISLITFRLGRTK